MGLRASVRRLPPIAWRDARLLELRDRNQALRSEVGRLEEEARELREAVAQRPGQPAPKYSPKEPSWHVRIMEQARVGRFTAPADRQAEIPRRRLLEKLHNYELARSYGVATPRVIGSWASVADVPWEDLPERFVIKSNRGYNSKGVLPLRRQGDTFAFLDSEREISSEEIVEHYATTANVRAPFFVEEVLPGTGAVLPDDIKIYAFYGEVALVMLRRVTEHAKISSLSFRFLDAEGADLGQVRQKHQYDPDIAVPKDLAHMVDVARVLSAAVPVPFVRADLYQVPDGVMLGEITPLPGGSEGFTREYDRLLGRLYDEAEGRLHLDFARGRPYAVNFGPHSRDVTAPMSAISTWPETSQTE
ncbi:hypothetical protein MWU75_03860 [Ornithinimicrobium sp. F0845]|uniref:ATP-grasp fold amidoligase family protein n=1 Tax=Ornithinimicrobium sp. F0845 TaxID=2926412 RepID=UPI001FF6C5B7|nr:ATP-grasp fold amidoligase family protein [Ornithinimicrobium sp. F0845]MCK0111274.1 hypothetical protein [Ornithinimicrobium sp. F0845]